MMIRRMSYLPPADATMIRHSVPSCDMMTSLQKRTAETPSAQRVKKTNHDGCTAQHAGA
jgi:hypothetical protein